VICYSQNNGGSLNATGDKSFLPNVTPPSPESFIFTEYGKNAVNEFSGKINLSVPVYNYKIGNLQLPVSINYSGAGVKVNDASTIVGTNWILNTGGVINRKINDKADESSIYTREFINYEQMKTDTEENCRPFSQYFVDLALDKDEKDTEIDEWSFNFNGYSGSFYLDQNFNPIYIENENEIKIEIIGNGTTNLEKLRNSKTFLITTPDGIRYYFGGLETEKTMVFSGHRGSSQLSDSSFYLYKIADRQYNEIILEYLTDQAALLKYGRSYQMTSAGSFTEYHIPVYTVTSMVNQINNPKFLKKIRNNKNNEEVVFNYNLYNNFHYMASLENIEVMNNSTIIKKVELTYSFPDNFENSYQPTASATRFFLNKVEINKFLLNVDGKYEVYKFEYDNNDLMPVRFSPKQDILGYFNNKQNQTTIPKPKYFQNSTSPSFGDVTPDFEYSKRGSLTKVIYPTGGFSTFEYESANAKEKKYKIYQRNIIGTEIGEIPSYNEITEEIEVFSPVYEKQEISIEINTGFNSNIDPLDGIMYYQNFHNLKVELTINDVTPGIPSSPSNSTIFRRNLGMNPGTTNRKFTFLKDHIYTIQIKLLTLPNISYPHINDIYASFKIELFDGYNIVDGFGVRIKNQKDYTDNNISQNYKRYYYKNINEINNIFFGISEIFLFPKLTITYDPNPENFQGIFINLFSESNLYSNKNLFETYQTVTISEGGNNFENGGTEKYFSKQTNESNTKLITINDGCFWAFDFESGSYITCGAPVEVSNGLTIVRNSAYTSEITKLDIFNGKLLMERNFVKKNNSIFKNKEVFYDYTIQRKHLNNAVNYVTWNLLSDQVALNFCPNDINTPIFALSGLFKAYYFIETFDIKLNKIVSKEYIEPIPLSQNVPYFTSFEQDVDPDYANHDLNFKKITTTQEFTYGTLKGLPLETKTYSSDGSMLLTKNYYPNQVNTLNNVTGDEASANSKLVSQNRIATPIQVEQYRNGDLLSTQRTVNKAWNNNPELILPEKILTSKGTQPLEERAIFSEYDANGNLSVLSLKDGSKTKYFYNNLNQVILKVENYSTSLNFPALPTWSNACNFIAQYPSALISIYNYDAVTNQITSIVNSNCKYMYYEYDALHRLKLIRDNENNIIQEFDQNYKPQN
jgi:hypothetical protein